MNGPFKMKPGRQAMPKTGRGVDVPTLMKGTTPVYQKDTRSGSKMEYDGGVLRKPKADGSSDVVLGGTYDASGVYIPKTASQKASDLDNDPRRPGSSESKRRFKARQEAEKNKPENVAKREENKAKLEAKKKAQDKKNNKK